MNPPCYNRPAFKQQVNVQNGWTEDGRRNMIIMEDNMTKYCHQTTPPFGEAHLHGWDCGDCRWLKRG